MVKAKELWFCAPYHVEIQDKVLSSPKNGEVCVQSLFSAISPGTEMLFYRGQFPQDMNADDSIEALQTPMCYPMPYGYASVGRIIELGPGVDATWLGRLVFAFQPHASHFLCPIEYLHCVPEDIAPEDAIFLPNMETAVSFVMDAQPMIGERVLVFGQGVVGLLCTKLLSQFPLKELTVVDGYSLRRERAKEWGAKEALTPQEAVSVRDKDVTFEVSGNPKALNQAIACTGYHGRVIVGSWYGNKPVQLDLGSSYHRSQLRLICSQVSNIQPQWRGRWSTTRRLSLAWSMIRRCRPSQLITHRFSFSTSAQAYKMLDDHTQHIIQPILVHDNH